MDIAISPVDVADDGQVDDALAVLTASRRHDVPDFPPPCRYNFVGMLRHPTSANRGEYALARLDGRVVGFVGISMPQRDNLDNSELELEVDPAYRRRGVGRALYGYAADLLRAEGRKRTAAMTSESLPGGVERDDSGRHFAIAMGAKDALGEVRRTLDLSTVDDDALAAMLSEAYGKAGAYRLVQWRDRVDDEYAADVAYLDGRLVTDAPMGDLAWGPEEIDVTRIRDSEAARQLRGVRSYASGMVHEASGRLVALTTIGFERSNPDAGHQWITLVDPDHRGHRLGMIVKIENLNYARAHEPKLSTVQTWNAASNHFMISINEAMGFRPVDSWVNWQAEV